MTREERRIYNQQYYRQNKDRILKKARENRQRYPDIYRERKRLYNKRQKAKGKEIDLQYADQLRQITITLRQMLIENGII